MVRHLSKPVGLHERPLQQWPSVAALLAGTQVRYIDGRTTTHRVIEAGAGEPLILVHGVGGHAEAWARNIRSLARHFHVYAIDALYHGFSTKLPFREDSFAAQAEAVVELIEALGHDAVHYEGESMGAAIGFELGMRFPDRCRKIVLNTGFGAVQMADPGKGIDPSAFARLRALSAEALDTSADAVRRRLEWLVHEPTRMTEDMVQIRQAVYSDGTVSESMRRFLRLGQDSYVPEMTWTEADAARFRPETLVFWTEHNPGQTPVFGEHAAALLPNSSYYCMADAGHWPQWEHPEEHDAIVTAFLLDRA